VKKNFWGDGRIKDSDRKLAETGKRGERVAKNGRGNWAFWRHTGYEFSVPAKGEPNGVNNNKKRQIWNKHLRGVKLADQRPTESWD